jgi:hypothetical protein
MFSWIPLLGPILQGISSIFQGYFSTKQTEIKATVDTERVAAQIIRSTNDDILLRILRDAAILPVVVWTMLIGWNTIVVHNFPHWVFTVERYPPSVEYLPYMILVFLFGNIGLNMWRSK